MGRVTDAGNKSMGAVRIGNWAGLADGEKITISRTGEGAFSKAFAFDNNAAGDPGDVLVDMGADAEEAIENLRAAIVAHLTGSGGTVDLEAYVDPVDPAVLRIEGAAAGPQGNLDFESTMGDPDNIIDAQDDKLYGGDRDYNLSRIAGSYVVKALDIEAENVMIPTPFEAPVQPKVSVRTSADVPKYITDKVKINGTRLQIEKNGATNLALGDVIDFEVMSKA